MNERTKTLNAMVDEFNRVHREWQSDGNRPNPDQLYWIALDELIEVFRDGDVPEDCRDLEEAVMMLGLERDAWDQREDVNRQYPPQAFFKAREQVERIRIKPVAEDHPKPVEPIEVLMSMPHMSPAQVARMHGLVDNLGRPESWKVINYMQKDKDGKRLWDFPDDYVPPHLRVKSEKKRSARAAFEAAMARKDAAEAASQPAPEPLEELLALPNITVKQVAKMKKTTEAEIVKQAQAAGLPLPKYTDTAGILAGKPKGLDQTQVGVGLSPAPDQHYPPGETTQQAVLRLSRESYENQEIADAMGLTPEVVQRIIQADSLGRRNVRDVVIPEKEEQPAGDPAERAAEVVG